MKIKRKALSLENRQSLWVMRAGGAKIREIGRHLRISASVVSRELRRNSVSPHVSVKLSPLERGKVAHQKAKYRLQNKKRGKRKARPEVAVYEHVALKLSEKWSPEAIANTWGEYFSGKTISTNTIYRMISKDWPKLKALLPERGKKRRAKVVNRRGKVQQAAADKRHVSERCEAANNRQEEGHLEIDSILSKRGSKAAIISIIDRKTRKRWYLFVPNLEANTVRKALVIFLRTLSAEQRRSITLDRGTEFAEWKMLESIFLGLKVYFCTAYSPHEKGSVERSNRDFRRFFPKKTDFSIVTQQEIDQAQNLINSKPMKCLRWKSPNNVYRSGDYDSRQAA